MRKIDPEVCASRFSLSKDFTFKDTKRAGAQDGSSKQEKKAPEGKSRRINGEKYKGDWGQREQAGGG